ncbi:hypothetical protein Q8A73_016497 [Channa argus]|nr:hypothetical protein Q8A73_016497 [Channa argus]
MCGDLVGKSGYHTAHGTDINTAVESEVIQNGRLLGKLTWITAGQQEEEEEEEEEETEEEGEDEDAGLCAIGGLIRCLETGRRRELLKGRGRVKRINVAPRGKQKDDTRSKEAAYAGKRQGGNRAGVQE